VPFKEVSKETELGALHILSHMNYVSADLLTIVHGVQRKLIKNHIMKMNMTADT
jgi:hypothetical protein